MAKNTTNATELFAELGGGAFADQLGVALSNVAESVVITGKKGQVTITLDIARIGDSRQVNIAHKLAFKEPTQKGSRSEDTTSETPVFLNAGGDVSVYAQDSHSLFAKEA